MNRNEFYTALSDYNDEHTLKHYGTKGQKWGVRRWQNADGTFNEAGKKRYFGKKNGVKEVWDKLNKPIGPFVKEKNYNLIKAKWNKNFNYDYSTPLFYKFTVRPNSAYDDDNKTKIVKNESELYSKAKKSGLESGDKYGYGTFDNKDVARLEKLNKLNKKGKLPYNSKEYDELERLKGKEYYSKHPDEYARDVEHIEKFKNDIDSIKDDGYKFDGPYDPDYGRKRITDEQYERMKSSTSLAYKADKWLSSNMDSNESFDTLDDDRQRNEMFWFAYEDQTIGMWRVADMINSGVPVNKVVRLIEDSNSFRSKGRLDIDILGTEGDGIRFDMLEGNYNDSLVNFAKECAKVKEDKDEIKHYGIKGQKWGVRKYQNKDGSLTPAGREHYGYGNVPKSGLKDFAKKAAHTVSKGVGKVGEKAGEKVFGNDTNGVSKISKKMDDWGSGKKSERKKAFDESTKLSGKEEAEAWKKLGEYYESQQKSGPKSSDKKAKPADNSKIIDDAISESSKNSAKISVGKHSDVRFVADKNDFKDAEKAKVNAKHVVSEFSKNTKDMIDTIANDLKSYSKDDSISVDDIKKNLRPCSVHMYTEKAGEVGFEHIDFNSKSALGGDHFFDFEFYVDDDGKVKFSKHFAMNG